MDPGTDCFHHPLFQRGKKDLASKIICTPRADLPAGANGAVGPKDQAKLMGMAGAMGNIDSKPPSLAGVEKFIRAKVAADAAKKNKGSAKKTNESAKLGVSGNDSDSLN